MHQLTTLIPGLNPDITVGTHVTFVSLAAAPQRGTGAVPACPIAPGVVAARVAPGSVVSCPVCHDAHQVADALAATALHT